MVHAIVRENVNSSDEYRKHYSQRVAGDPTDPYAFTAQILNLAEPRVRQAFSDLQRHLHEQHERGVEEVMDQIRGRKVGFRKLPTLTLPIDPFKILTELERGLYGLPLGFRSLVEHVKNPTRLQDGFVYADGDMVEVVTYGAQGGTDIPKGMARLSTTAIVVMDGATHSDHVFPPEFVKL